MLSEQVIYGLNDEQMAELGRLEKEFPELRDDVSLELAAAQLALSDLKTDEPLPPSLRARVLADAEQFFESREIKEESRQLGVATEPITAPAAKLFDWSWLGWGLAAAACLVLALNLWMTRWQPPDEIVKTPAQPTVTPAPELSPAQKLEQFLAASPDVVRTSWSAPPNAKEAKDVSGEVVWSNAKQQGFMRFRNLPANDPGESTYQLWIVDAERKEKYPVNGGTFDVSENREVIVPINAELKIGKPAVFAVTKEKPGGVVVSTQEQFVAVAKV